jgi:membrane associated rhomboid family serine protease
MKKIEFSKIALGSAVIAYFAVIIFSAWVAAKCVGADDFSSASVVIGAVTAVVGTVTGIAYAFYSHKAKCENVVKLSKTLSKKQVEEIKALTESIGGLQ